MLTSNEDTLREIYYALEHSANSNGLISLDVLETLTGRSIHSLRVDIEDLKEAGLVHLHNTDLEITSQGVSFIKSHWV